MLKKVYENEELKIGAIVEVDNETWAKWIELIGVNSEGVGHLLGKVSVRDLVKGKGVDFLGNVIPQFLLEVDEEGKNKELQEIKERLKELLQDVQNHVSSGMTWDFKELHQEVCSFVGFDSKPDYYTIADGKCRVRSHDLQYILNELDSGWSVNQFVKSLKRHNMLHTDNGRLQKWVTDSSGKGGQYRAYVFDTEFKGMEVR